MHQAHIHHKADLYIVHVRQTNLNLELILKTLLAGTYVADSGSQATGSSSSFKLARKREKRMRTEEWYLYKTGSFHQSKEKRERIKLKLLSKQMGI